MEQQKGYGSVPPPYGQQNNGYQAPPGQPQYSQPPPSQQTVVVTSQPVHVAGGCQVCGGYMKDEFTVLGIILAVLFFPIGILCCLLMTKKRCSNCGR